MIEEIRQLVHEIQKMPDAQRHAAQTVAIFKAISFMIYYIMLGVVTIILGRRLIYATLNAWKEARRET